MRFATLGDEKATAAGKSRISAGASRYGPMCGRLAAESGELPGKKAARAGGIAQIRNPPYRPPGQILMGVVMGLFLGALGQGSHGRTFLIY